MQELTGALPGERERRPFQNRQNQMGPGWGKRRARQLKRFPTCQWKEDGIFCGAPAKIVDHIKPRFEGGSDDDDNLQSLCEYHSGIKTAHEANRAWAKRKADLKKKFSRKEKHPGEP